MDLRALVRQSTQCGETRGAHTQGFPHRPLEVDYLDSPRQKSFCNTSQSLRTMRHFAIIFHLYFHITY
jgi:hypothetical protein